MAKIIRLAGITLTDLTAPKILIRDPIESDGSLFLFDGAHVFGQFSGLPGSGGEIPNVLSDRATTLIGNPDVNGLVGVLEAPGIFLVERTVLGGIHGISTLAGAQNSPTAYAVRMSIPTRSYILANPTHHFYASLWSRVTRTGIPNVAQQSPFHFAQSTSNYQFHFQTGRAEAPTGGASLGRFNLPSGTDADAGAVVPYNRFGALGWSAPTGTGATSAVRPEFAVGVTGAWGSLNYNKAPSRIIYRAYIEDLTASGRTFAQVQAIDYTLYQAAFAPGGKFHNDTYTDPATLP